eukprot:465658_1
MLSVTMAMINVIFCFVIPAAIAIRKQRADFNAYGNEDKAWCGICGVCCCSTAMLVVFIVVYMTAFVDNSIESYEAIYSYTIDGECAGAFDTGDYRIRHEIDIGDQYWLHCTKFGDVNYCIQRRNDKRVLEIWSVQSYAQSCLQFAIPFANLTESLAPVCTQTNICFGQGFKSLCVTKASTMLSV